MIKMAFSDQFQKTNYKFENKYSFAKLSLKKIQAKQKQGGRFLLLENIECWVDRCQKIEWWT